VDTAVKPRYDTHSRQQFAAVISDKTVLTLLDGFLNHLIDKDSLLIENKKGVPRGSPLSPLIGAMYLQPLDDAMAKLPVRYARFMDDWIAVADTRWKQRRSIRVMNQVLENLKVKKHPDKTDVGRVEKDIDFLGYRLGLKGLTLSQQTLSRLATNMLQLQEQQVSHPRLATYWRRFVTWSFSGLHNKINWETWLTAALEYFGRSRLLNLLQLCAKKFSPPLAVLQTLYHV
jgi:RNA-directed DNA polymerase